MTPLKISRAGLAAGALVAAATLAGGVLIGRATAPEHAAPAPAGRKVLYWYDPMVPGQRFDKPGKSPYMDMALQPKYADEAGGGGVRIDPARTQNLGVRLATVERGLLPGGVAATGVIEYNERDLAVVQAKAAGFVQRVYARAPGDVIAAGAPLADILVPEWAGAQAEFLAVRTTGDAALTRAARQRLQLLGMPPSLVEQVERSGRVRNVVTVSAPAGGAIKTLGVRAGMTVAAGQTLAEVNSLSRVWLNAAVPEALAGEVRPGQSATATLTAYPGEIFEGRVAALLPQADAASRTITARVELANPRGRLRPGMFANVQLAGTGQPALLAPSEAVIRTGRRSVVMVAGPGGGFQAAEVRTGREAGGRTEILQGLSEGEKVVASGQFLIDSEASLAGLRARPAQPEGDPHAGHAAPALLEGAGRIEALSPVSVTLSHGAIPGVGWPAMTMAFRLADPALARGLKVGDRVRFAFDQQSGPTVRRMSPEGQP
ncbi:efflux RND transporter periplasmic adaptor subunit [Phenylobacterium sp.]|uniref:efflux RND transporter periplasmic adaptor subunit n=1 Tax=Phenylobacterium sp. TaxID=1871053 RepID=UPI002FCB7CA8